MIRLIKWYLFLAVGFYLSAILTVWPIETSFQWYRPQWIFMFVIFCQVVQPRLFNPILACALGLLMDSLLGTPLGLYALICAVIAYLSSLLRPQFFQRPLWLQMDKVLLLVCLGQILVLWFHAFAGQNPQTLWYWMGSASSCIVWPLFVLLFQGVSQLFRVAPLSSSRSL